MPGRTFPIIGIGSSAGGLDALKAFFSALPPDCGMAFVIVAHRDPAGVSMLPEILGKLTPLPVVDPGEGTAVKRNHIYVAPGARYLKLNKGRLEFHHIVMQDGLSLPIDFFFRSLAEDQRDRAICVIMSGSGSDGTLGMMAVKGAGGMAMAQDLATAQFDSMPGHAIATGNVDYVLAPGEMPGQLLKYAATLQSRPAAPEKSGLEGEVLADILALVRKHTGSDFSRYKVNTLRRRIERRMNIHHIAEARQYIQYLRDNSHEAGLLFKELLIGVTGFFRDPPAWDILEREILPALLKDKAEGDPVRIWIPGCSTGEEAYSIAILLLEYMEREKKKFNVQIYATDIDAVAIAAARSGMYSEGIALEITPERLKRWFLREDSHFRVAKTVRETITFATQNILQDPPFTKLDMVCCRNLLIYLDAGLQRRVIPLFHYALKPGGIMFLGSSETIGSFLELFNPIHARWKFFARKETPFAGRQIPAWSNGARMPAQDAKTEVTTHMANEKNANIAELAQKTLLAHHIPPTLIVNDRGDIYFIHGRTGGFLEPRPGQPAAQQNALDMAREGLKSALAGILLKAAATEHEIVQSGVRVRSNGHFITATLRARKITEPEAMRGLIWISFASEDDKSAPTAERIAVPEDGAMDEVQFVKNNLRNTIEELETANEDLKSTNEELQSTNEELQSANEELETAKEEMQSLNEELHTVNAELESKVSELAHANDDMKNLLNSTGIATLFLDNQLHIKRFTSQARKIMRVIQGDIGRPISDIVSELEYPNLVKDASEVLQTLAFKEVEVRARDWSWYFMRIMPYRTTENVIDGLVVTFVDITKVKKSEILLAITARALRMMMLENASLERVLDEILLAIERQTMGIWCSVSFIEAKSQRLEHIVAPSLPKPFNDMLDGIHIGPDEPAPCAVAAATDKSVMVADIAALTPNTPFTTLALRHNVKAAWAEPIHDGAGEIMAVLTVYYHQAHKPSEVEEELITQTIPLIATAISRHHRAK